MSPRKGWSGRASLILMSAPCRLLRASSPWDPDQEVLHPGWNRYPQQRPATQLTRSSCRLPLQLHLCLRHTRILPAPAFSSLAASPRGTCSKTPSWAQPEGSWASSAGLCTGKDHVSPGGTGSVKRSMVRERTVPLTGACAEMVLAGAFVR